MHFSDGFKQSMVKKLLTPGGKGGKGVKGVKGVKELSTEIGVTTQTLYNWRDKYNIGDDRILQERIPSKWNNREKYSAILTAARLTGTDLGKWLRETGLQSKHLELWEKEIKEMVSSPKDKQEIRELKKKNKILEKELARKEKALAEVAALLTLKKKAAALWGEEEE
jgi:transposase